MPKVTVINPIDQASLMSTVPKQRVCAYCRVSSDSHEQLQSFSAQIEHYTAMIEKNPKWQFSGVYADEGISGTSKNKRDEFLRLIRDCEARKIDMVITKSISRFARNTKDSIETIRLLKSLGIGVYFEKENINTLSGESELVLTILSSMAQEESLSISKNIKWSCQKRFQSGEWIPSCLPYGYAKDNDGYIIVEESEAETVRRIYNEYLNGKGAYIIAKGLTHDGILPRRGGEDWSENTVMDILLNEKYTGDLLMQKTFTTDTIPFIRKRNAGQRQKYLVTDNHEPIISREQAERVREIAAYRKAQLQMRNADITKYNNRYPFSSRILCGECGHIFKRRIIFKGKPYEYVQWSCSNHIQNIDRCGMKAVREEAVMQAFINLFNKLKCNCDKILTPLLEGLKNISVEDYNGEEIRECNKKIGELAEEIHILSRLRSQGYINSALFIERNNFIDQEVAELKNRRNELFNVTTFDMEIDRTEQLIRTIRSQNRLMENFDEKLFGIMVDKIVVKSQSEIVFILINDLELIEYL